MIFSERIEKAIRLSANAHDGQCRRWSIPEGPYVAHPYMVASILKEMGCDEDTIIAGLFHDAVEDTKCTIDDVRGEFGERVAHLVNMVTDEDGLSFEDRKRHQFEKIKNGTPEVKAIKAADTLHNIYSLYRSVEQGVDITSFLNCTVGQYIWSYEQMLLSLRFNWDHPITDEISLLLDKLKEGSDAIMFSYDADRSNYI